MNEQQEGNRQQEKRGVSLTVLDLISRQSFLSCENKFLARLWKDLVFTAAGPQWIWVRRFFRETTCSRISGASSA